MKMKKQEFVMSPYGLAKSRLVIGSVWYRVRQGKHCVVKEVRDNTNKTNYYNIVVFRDGTWAYGAEMHNEELWLWQRGPITPAHMTPVPEKKIVVDDKCEPCHELVELRKRYAEAQATICKHEQTLKNIRIAME